jgi:hypothetical protein
MENVAPKSTGNASRVKTNDSSIRDENLNVPKSKKKGWWSEAETVALVVGCEVYGVGNWAKIKEENEQVFKSRTSINLKDKYRTLATPQNANRLDKLKMKAKQVIKSKRKA